MKKLLVLFFAIYVNFTFAQAKNAGKQISPPGAASASIATIPIYETVDQPAEFPGGFAEFRLRVSNNVNVYELDSIGNFSTEVTFVIERDGVMTDVKSKGENMQFNLEAIKAVRMIEEKWAPAEVKGLPVRIRYRLPLRIVVM